MGIENQCSKGGNYIGGFLQMFDWNANSRKKLFSSKSEVTEKSKQNKRCDGNSPRTHLSMIEMDEKAAVSSVGGSSDQSCASSLVDEDFYGTKAPGVVARLMGLDSLPKSSMPEPYSTPLFSSSSFRDAYYLTKNSENPQESRLQGLYNRNEMELNYPRVIHKPIEKFQTETLPPKSAKSIPITHHKLLSPIKSANFIPPKDAAHIMEAAARIIEPGPSHLSTKTKLPPVGASSVPLRIRGLKEKAEAAQKPSKIFEGSRRKAESSLRGNTMVKSWNGSVGAMAIRVMPDSDGTSSNGVKSNGKTISLALQAKANVQKRVGLSLNGNKNIVSQKDLCELSPNHPLKSQSTTSSPNHPFKSQSTTLSPNHPLKSHSTTLSPNHPLKSQSTAQKSTTKKQSMQNGSSVLQQNNQKQNCIVDRGKLSSKCNSKGGKTTPSGESLSTRQRNSSKVSSNSRVNLRKLSSEVIDEKREALPSCKERVTSKKRSVDGSYHLGKNQAVKNLQMDRSGKVIQSRDITDRQSSWDQESGANGTDVVSFTFKSPMTRLASDSLRPGEAGETCKILSAGYQSKRSDDMSGSRFSFCGNNVKGGDALNTLLEQKLKELADKVEFSPQNSVGLEETRISDGNISRARKLLDRRLPSSISVLEHSSFPDSCSSSDTADSNSTRGSKQCSSIHTTEELDSFSSKTYLADEPDAELSDSASSTSIETVPKRKEIILASTDNVSRRRWEFKYVKEMLSNIELKFKDYAVGRTQGIVNPRLFNQLESCNQFLSNGVEIPVIDQRVLFDCVSECLNLRCRQFVGGGYRSLAKGLSLVRQEGTFAQEVHREISGWNANIGDSMIDELVDKDMSNQYGRWVDFDIEAFELGTQIQSQILNSLIDEVVADIH
ncbi:uncharacterized protein LOC121770115 [Salvia splendens]|uniref:uncharacterized protein LOC121770115 n=1 Tax=Salvia splendens TaxID=180675 RepID=UPI001C2759AC|nr:uncharacterized protein LOC121770115 [Salvia splendens]